MFDWLNRLFSGSSQSPQNTEKNRSGDGMITRKCRMCGKVIILPENVQYWPDCCQECRAKYRPVEMITRKCRSCQKNFSFRSDVRNWPKYCGECQAKKKR